MPSTSSNCHVWIWRIDQQATVLRRLERHLSKDELSRARRFKDPAHAEHYCVAHGVTREILESLLGIPAADIDYEIGFAGKPVLRGALGKELHFNLSHTSHGGISAAVLATSKACPIGADIEAVRPIEPEIEEELTAAEKAYLSAIGSTLQRRNAFFRLWTLKEAALKASGHGLGDGIGRISIVPDSTHPRVSWTQHGLPSPERYQLHAFDPIPGCAGAAAALDLSEKLRVALHRIDPSCEDFLYSVHEQSA